MSSEAVASASDDHVGDQVTRNSEGSTEVLANGTSEDSLSEEEEEEKGDVKDTSGNEEFPISEPAPPVPPRNHSLSPGPASAYFRDYLKDDIGGKTDIYGSDVSYPWVKESTTAPANSIKGSFLSEGRGGEIAHSPPLPNLTNGVSSPAGNGDYDDKEVPPPIPSKVGRKKSGGSRLEEISEEKALLGELDLLEKLMELKQEKKLEASGNSEVTEPVQEEKSFDEDLPSKE